MLDLIKLQNELARLLPKLVVRIIIESNSPVHIRVNQVGSARAHCLLDIAQCEQLMDPDGLAGHLAERFIELFRPHLPPDFFGKRPYRLKDGQECPHAGCAAHLTEPCNGCGRIAARGPADYPSEYGRSLLDNPGLAAAIRLMQVEHRYANQVLERRIRD